MSDTGFGMDPRFDSQIPYGDDDDDDEDDDDDDFGFYDSKKKNNHTSRKKSSQTEIQCTPSEQGIETNFMIVAPSASDGHATDADASWRGTWLCRPYKRERLLEEIYSANRKGVTGHAAVLNTLKNTGVMIFIIDSKVSTNTADIMDSIRNVINHVAKEERSRPSFNPRESQRCLLYRDHEGRFFNLTLATHTTSAASRWKDLSHSFSGLQALAVLTILSRSFSCATSSKNTVVLRMQEPTNGTVLDSHIDAFLVCFQHFQWMSSAINSVQHILH